MERLKSPPAVNTSVDVAYTIETSVWNNELRLQLIVQDLRY